VVYARRELTVADVIEVRSERVDCPGEEQETEYRVTVADGGSDGEGLDQYILIEVAVIVEVLKLRGVPGGDSVQRNLASSAWEHVLILLTFLYVQSVSICSVLRHATASITIGIEKLGV
jgi:hypothetical protein